MPASVTTSATTAQSQIVADPRVRYLLLPTKAPAAVYKVVAHPPTPRA